MTLAYGYVKAKVVSGPTLKSSSGPGDQPSKREPYSRSASSPSAATRAQISCTAARSFAK